MKGDGRVAALRERGARRADMRDGTGKPVAAVRAVNVKTGFEFKTAYYDPNWKGECARLQNPARGINAIVEYHPDKKHLVYTVGHDEGKLDGEERLYDYETGAELQLERNWVRNRKTALDNRETVRYKSGGVETKEIVLAERRVIDKPGQKLLYKEFVLATTDYPVSLPHGGVAELPARQWRDALTGEFVRAIWCDLGHEYYAATPDELRDINATGKFPAKLPRID